MSAGKPLIERISPLIPRLNAYRPRSAYKFVNSNHGRGKAAVERDEGRSDVDGDACLVLPDQARLRTGSTGDHAARRMAM
jgi:hypothetical protein